MWLSLVEHHVRDVGVASSNLVTSTIPGPDAFCVRTQFFIRRVILVTLYPPSLYTKRVIIMNIAVVYSSVTGNTEKVAEAIKNAVAASGENVTYFGKPQSGIEADVYFIGSWTDKGTCSAETAEMLKETNGKKIAYFGTAGFGGEQSYFDALSSRALSLLPEGNKVLGSFFCQGKMPMSVRERYVKMITAHPDDKKLQVSLDNFDAALTHPDEDDLKKAAEWAKNILKK